MPDDTAEIAAQDASFLTLRKCGRPRKGSEKSDVTTFIGRGRNYNVARLDRDRPDLSARVHAGTMTANAAAVEAGFRKKVVRRKKTKPSCPTPSGIDVRSLIG